MCAGWCGWGIAAVCAALFSLERVVGAIGMRGNRRCNGHEPPSIGLDRTGGSIVRRNTVTVGIVLVAGLGVTLIGGCATDKSTAAASSEETVRPAARPIQPRRNRLVSGDSLGEKIVDSDPSLSSSSAPIGDRTTAAIFFE